ncbi:acyltransferase family protein [Verrucosispora sp. TAA-831]|uniref:acyltransferase family protein n=1 Tax=Verrucosispora sp. TAA-831 TaxID=3422227 RepID=UPI003D6FD125
MATDPVAAEARRAPGATGVAPVVAVQPRTSYLDLLRAAALARVLLYHATGWLWLSLLVPAMGVMFGVAGALLAASLDRYGTRAIGRRMRRLLVPFWAFGATVLALVAVAGQVSGAPSGFGWDDVCWWLLPLRVPSVGGAPWGWAFTVGLWYVSTYLWLTLLSPLLLPLYRRWPWPVLAAATALPVCTHLAGVTQFYFVVSYLPCWLLGFAYHDGLLGRVSARLCRGLVLVLGAVGGTWVLLAVTTGAPSELNHIPAGSTIWSMAWVAALLRLAPRSSGAVRATGPARAEGDRPARGGALLRLVNARALTVYLWHIPASAAITALLMPWLSFDSVAHVGLRLVGMILLTVAAALAVGWIEDLAARRRPRLLWVGAPATPRPPRRSRAEVPRRRAAVDRPVEPVPSALPGESGG